MGCDRLFGMTQQGFLLTVNDPDRMERRPGMIFESAGCSSLPWGTPIEVIRMAVRAACHRGGRGEGGGGVPIMPPF